jgi:hypothetical protein
MSSKKRLIAAAATITSIASVVVLVAGVTFGFFNDQTSPQAGTFTAGTVSLNHSSTFSCTPTNIAAGDTNYLGCRFDVTYTGSLPAFIGAQLTGASGTLYSSDGMQFQVGQSNAATGYWLSQPTTSSPVLYQGTASSNQVITVYVGYSLPSAATDQNSSATVNLTVNAVQQANNPLPSGGCNVGQSCAINWS